VRLSHAVEGATDSTKQYVLYDVPVSAYSTRIFTVGIAMEETDVLRVRSDTGLVAFNAWGMEVQ
jgi:hypothetical protein